MPYQQDAAISVDRSTGIVTATMTNEGRQKAVNMQVYPDGDLLTFDPIPHTVAKGSPKNQGQPQEVHLGRHEDRGPVRLLELRGGPLRAVIRRHGRPRRPEPRQVPRVEARLVVGGQKVLKITLANDGLETVTYTLTPNDYEGRTQTLDVEGGKKAPSTGRRTRTATTT